MLWHSTRINVLYKLNVNVCHKRHEIAFKNNSGNKIHLKQKALCLFTKAPVTLSQGIVQHVSFFWLCSDISPHFLNISVFILVWSHWLPLKKHKRTYAKYNNRCNSLTSGTKSHPCKTSAVPVITLSLDFRQLLKNVWKFSFWYLVVYYFMGQDNGCMYAWTS